jgi:lambda family phage portal protein
MVDEALADGQDELSSYQQLRSDWADERPAMFNGVRVPTLAPGEEIKAVSAAHPHDAFEGFAKEMLRSVASAIGISAEQLSQDWSKTNYSSARAALLESWKTLVRRRDEFATGFATPLYSCWLHEVHDRDELPLPAGAPSFLEMRTAYSRCTWLGPGRGWVDPVKEKAGAILGMDAGLSTLKRESAEQGNDWEEDIDQRAIELAKFAEKGMAAPSWAAAEAAITATEAADPPPEPQPA